MHMISTRRGAAGLAAHALLTSTILAGTPEWRSPPTPPATAASTAGSTQLGELIVTANKRSENIQNVPMAIQDINAKLIKQLNINGFADLVKFMPSVNIQTGRPAQYRDHLHAGRL